MHWIEVYINNSVERSVFLKRDEDNLKMVIFLKVSWCDLQRHIRHELDITR